MKSYYDDHESAYKEIKAKGYVGWGNKKSLADLGDSVTIDFLKSSIAQFTKKDSNLKALDLGCGTGTTAFTMAALGLKVTGIDVSQTAIEMARELAKEQKLDINFEVGDILNLKDLNQTFDVIYDSHCLHCIVFDEDRKRVFEGIKSSLSNNGVFILDTSVKTDSWDPADKYDSLRFDENYILWHKTRATDTRGVVEINGQSWCAQRRFYPAEIVLDEIERAGFNILSKVDHQYEGESGMLRLVVG